MKIILNLSNEQIIATFKMLQVIENVQPTFDYEQKLIRSMLWEAYEKFTQLKKKSTNQNSLFDQNKKRKVVLKFYEAHALHKVLNDLSSVHDIYYKNILQKIADDLNQKLT